MVSAPPKDAPSPSSPPLSEGEGGEGDERSNQAMEMLRRAVEAQETRVRMLRARKLAREQLLQRIQSLRATGDTLEAHTAVRDIMGQAEATLEHLVQLDSSGVSFDNTTSVDPATHLLDSDADGQLMEEKGSHTVHRGPSPDPVDDAAPSQKQKAKRRRRATKKHTAGHVDPAEVSAQVNDDGLTIQHREATTALLAKSRSREAAGRAAMLAALASLHLTLQTENARGSTGSREPAWLHLEEEKKEEEKAEVEGEALHASQVEGQQRLPSSPRSPPHHPNRLLSTAASTEEYSDDFEARSEAAESTGTHEDSAVEEEEPQASEEKAS